MESPSSIHNYRSRARSHFNQTSSSVIYQVFASLRASIWIIPETQVKIIPSPLPRRPSNSRITTLKLYYTVGFPLPVLMLAVPASFRFVLLPFAPRLCSDVRSLAFVVLNFTSQLHSFSLMPYVGAPRDILGPATHFCNLPGSSSFVGCLNVVSQELPDRSLIIVRDVFCQSCLHGSVDDLVLES